MISNIKKKEKTNVFPDLIFQTLSLFNSNHHKTIRVFISLKTLSFKCWKKNMCDFYIPKIENSLIWRKKPHSSWLFYYYEEKKSRIKKSRNQIMQWTPTSFFMFDTFVPYKPKARSRLCRLCSWRISSIRRTRSLEHSSCVTAKIRVKNLRWLYFLEFPVTSVTFTL